VFHRGEPVGAAVVGQSEQEALDATTSEGNIARMAPASVSSQLAMNINKYRFKAF
jgi:hypothetical protein